ncbi:Hypothetical predicted protein, partial [Paramuricea clavata]
MLRSNLSNIPREINEQCPSIHLLAESQDLTVQAKANKIVLAIASYLKQDENQPASRGSEGDDDDDGGGDDVGGNGDDGGGDDDCDDVGGGDVGGGDDGGGDDGG